MAPPLMRPAEEEVSEQGQGALELGYSQIAHNGSGSPDDASALLDSHGENGDEESDADPPGTEASGNASGTCFRGGRVVTRYGMEFHIFGDLRGLELSEPTEELSAPDIDDEEDERKRVEADIAIREAERADELRRSAPLPPEHCRAIVEAMKGITLGSFRPDWAQSIPEDEWMNKVKNRRESKDGGRLKYSSD